MNNKFNELGYEIIPGLLSWSERRLILQHIKHADGKACSTWSKGLAAEDAFYARLASQKKIIEILTPKLGENIIHWATDIVERPPSAAHPWHCDIESCEPEGGFVSIWIGLKHTSKKSSLALISRSIRTECGGGTPQISRRLKWPCHTIARPGLNAVTLKMEMHWSLMAGYGMEVITSRLFLHVRPFFSSLPGLTGL